MGPDEIPNPLLKRYAKWVSKYLFVIYSASLEGHQVPLDWFMVRVVPVYKYGDKHSVENHRPISLTCACCKLPEHIASKKLYTHLEESKPFLSRGFRRSAAMQLAETSHDFAESVNHRLMQYV